MWNSAGSPEWQRQQPGYQQQMGGFDEEHAQVMAEHGTQFATAQAADERLENTKKQLADANEEELQYALETAVLADDIASSAKLIDEYQKELAEAAKTRAKEFEDQVRDSERKSQDREKI